MKDELSNLLGTWTEPVSEPASFNREVWARIEAESASGGWLGELLRVVARPHVAAGLAVVAVACGVLAGTVLSRDSGSEAYLRSVNPYAMNR